MNLVEKYFFKERRDALRIRIWRSLLKYNTSYPYVSGDAFAKICDYSAFGKDGSRLLNIKKLRNARKLFVPGHMLDKLLRENFDDIRASVLICGNSDENFVVDPILPDSIELWLCQNYAVEDGIAEILPIGLENIRLGKSGFKRLMKNSSVTKRNNKILVPPMRITNPIRQKIVDIAVRNEEIFHVYERYLDTKKYFRLVESYKYVLVLEGNGFDTHRLWECCYLGCTPVLLESPWSRKLMRELPIQAIVLSDLNSIDTINLEKLSMQENSELLPRSLEFLWMPYWENKVNYLLS